MKTAKRAAAALMALLAVVSVIYVTVIGAFAISPEANEGECGRDLIWRFYPESGVLYISGTGDMYDYSFESPAPWSNKKDDIKEVTLSAGVTSVGSYAFYGIRNLVQVALPEGLTKIGDSAFRNILFLDYVKIPDSVTQLGECVFESCVHLKMVDFGSGISEIKEGTFNYDSNLNTLYFRGRLEKVAETVFIDCRGLRTVNYIGTREEWNARVEEGKWQSVFSRARVRCHASSEHQFGEWETIKEATFDEEGELKHTCTFCGVSEKKTTNSLVYPFVDVTRNTWYTDAVIFCRDKGYMSGVSENRFQPSGRVTRSMVVTVLWRMAGAPVSENTMDPGRFFTDVKPDKWYSNAVIWAKEKGVAHGVSADRFDPESIVTREQLAVMFMQYSVKILGEDASERGYLAQFSDANKISGWAVDAMSWAVNKGLFSGRVDSMLAPKGRATRAELAQIIFRFVIRSDRSENLRSDEKLSEKWGFTLRFYALANQVLYDGGGFPDYARCYLAVYPDADEGRELPEIEMIADVSCIAGSARGVKFEKKVSYDGTVYYKADSSRLYYSGFLYFDPNVENDPIKVDLTVTVGGESLTVTYYVDVDFMIA